MSSIAGKKIVVGVTGSIAAFKVAGWVSHMAKDEAIVDVVMSESAKRFVTPLTFSALSGRKVYGDMFIDDSDGSISHIELAAEADIVLIAPATAQTIARLAHGMADDLLSAMVLATRAKVVVCPAMNSQMFNHPATQSNLARLKEFGYKVVDPDEGMMACKDQGKGRLPKWEKVLEIILANLTDDDLAGEHFLITAGPTREPLDPARFLSNRSSGKMGYALAIAARRRGANVTLVSGPTSLDIPYGVDFVSVQTALEMRDALKENYESATVIIKSAAVSDFRPSEYAKDKVKKEQADLFLDLVQNPDILGELGANREGEHPILVGFAAESKNLEEEGVRKLKAKNLDMICVNDISSKNTGFEVDTNQVTIFTRSEKINLPLASKIQTADMILTAISSRNLEE